ncbi:MAG: flippase-like domain-containing protein [Chloroflexi bacterium]|nr:flippase-like domain-containing protein [Chloroflexota bacterium]
MSIGYESPVAAVASPRVEQPAKKRNGPLGQILKIAIAVGVSAYVLWQVGLSDALATLASADWRWVGLAACSALVAMIVNVKRWQIMIGGQKDAAPLLTLIRLYLIAMFFNNILPSRFAGDVVRAYGASIHVTSKARSAAAVLMDRLIGAISVLLLAVIAIAANPSVVPWQISQVLIAGLAVGLGTVGLLVIRTPLHAPALALIRRLTSVPVVGKRFGSKAVAAAEAVYSYADAPSVLTWALAISMVANGLSIVNLYLYSLAVGADVHLIEVAVVAPVVLVVGLLPLSINGIGTQELVFVALLGLMGVEPEVALAVALLRRLVLLGQSLVGGGLYAVRKFG